MADIENGDTPRLDAADGGQPVVSGDLCRCLRSKEMYIHIDEPGWSMADSHSGIFWCIHTQNCIGPDGQVVEPQNCTPGRSCHQAR